MIRIPEVLAEELLRIARVLDEGGALPVTGNLTESDSHVTGNQLVNAETLKESANTFIMTIPPKERRSARKLLYKFIDYHCSFLRLRVQTAATMCHPRITVIFRF